MFDPTVFENLKVAFENRLYDLDNIEGSVTVTGRRDLLDLAVLTRELTLQFVLAGGDPGKGTAEAELVLTAPLAELAAEILASPGAVPGCGLLIRFRLWITEPDRDCDEIGQIVQDVWQPQLPPVQTLSYTYGETPARWLDTVELRFNRMINEDQMEDIPELLGHAVLTLERLASRPGR